MGCQSITGCPSIVSFFFMLPFGYLNNFYKFLFSQCLSPPSLLHAAINWVITQHSSPLRALRDDPNNGCIARRLLSTQKYQLRILQVERGTVRTHVHMSCSRTQWWPGFKLWHLNRHCTSHESVYKPSQWLIRPAINSGFHSMQQLQENSRIYYSLGQDARPSQANPSIFCQLALTICKYLFTPGWADSAL